MAAATWVEADQQAPKKQRHTVRRIFERLRDEHSYPGGLTMVSLAVRDWRQSRKEVFLPLSHPPGHAQADFGEAVAIIGGVEQKAHFFLMDLPHSDACFVRAYPAATAEAWTDGHVDAFAFFGQVPLSILYDNDRCLVTKILPDGTRKRARLFSALQSHYLFHDRYGRPGKGNDKGSVEGLVGFARRNFMVPVPRFATWAEFNAYLEAQCQKRQNDVLRGHKENIGGRLQRDRQRAANRHQDVELGEVRVEVPPPAAQARGGAQAGQQPAGDRAGGMPFLPGGIGLAQLFPEW